MKQWSAAEAKANLSDVVDGSAAEPQVILRHGKPVSVVIDYETFMAKRMALSGGLASWVAEVSEIASREEDMDEIVRVDRVLPSGLGE